MQKFRKSLFLAALLSCFWLRPAAQTFEHAGEYLDYVNKANNDLTAKYLFYLSAVSHGKSARKVEKRRGEVINAINETRYNIQGLPPWKGDRSFKDTTVAYLKLLYTVFNEDYGKIVNMEEIAEQSYDAMEAYMLAQQKAYEKLNAAGERQFEVQKQFASKNNINLVDNTTDMERKSKIVNEVMTHCNQVYLIFFKPYKQEAYLMESITKKNIVSIEQNLNALEKFAAEGLEKLKDLKGYQNDGSLIAACRSLLIFYRSEAKKGPQITDYFLKEEEFNKVKKQFESKPASKRTQQDVDQYNNAVNNINSALNSFNSLMKELYKESSSLLNNWNKTYSSYMDQHMPRQQRQ